MLRLRLARSGRRNQPKYRIVVAEKTEKLNGKVVATVGHYIPTGTEKTLVIDKEAITAWIAKGVIASNTVAKLLNTQGFKLAVEMAPVRPAKKAPKEEPVAAAPAPAAEAAPAEATVSEEMPAEAPAEEVKSEEPVVEEAPAEEVVAEAPAAEEPAAEEASAVDTAAETPETSETSDSPAE